ncbi:MAG TPA: PKD domain-containing protein [Paludibacteraceae bacterium]|nr:PKD domain-containing protein [Paludibacteraceae bacterium]HOL01153.1 PKD domain-containing protein [Paludibacteraceae bacterium]HPO67864.1 PKD domain-containing protein [Paludibacteraceae bacterium]
MKNIIKYGMWIMLSIFMFAACSPQEDEKYSLGELGTITADVISFSQTPSDTSNNVIIFTNTSNLTFPVTAVWDLGNGSTARGNTATGIYPMKGDYTVTLTLYAADGSSASKSEVIHIENDDFGLINTPVYVKLTGGIHDSDGKTWVFDQYNNFAKEVEEATGFYVKGHMGLAKLNTYSQEWWHAQPNEKKDWKLYDFKFTFIQDGLQLRIQNAGKGYGRSALQSDITSKGFDIIQVADPDIIFSYDGGDYTFSIDESGQYPKLTLSGNAFMGYYCGTQEYEIIYQTDSVMALRVAEPAENLDWIFVYCLEELNVPAIDAE